MIKNNTNAFIKILVAIIIIFVMNIDFIILNIFQAIIFPMVIYIAYLTRLDKDDLKRPTNINISIILGALTGLISGHFLIVKSQVFWL